MGRGTISRELDKLVGAGILTVSRTGNQNHYQANRNNPVYGELVGIAKKTFDIADQIHHALQQLDEKIELVFYMVRYQKVPTRHRVILTLC